MLHTILALSGEPAVGKTTLARELVGGGGVTLDTDTLCAPLRDAALNALGLPPAAVDGALYREQLRPAVYRCLMDTALHLVTQVELVVIDGPFHPDTCDPAYWALFSERAAASGARLIRVHLRAEPHVVHQRMHARGSARDLGKLANWAQHRAYWDFPLTELAVVIDTTEPDFVITTAARLTGLLHASSAHS